LDKLYNLKNTENHNCRKIQRDKRKLGIEEKAVKFFDNE